MSPPGRSSITRRMARRQPSTQPYTPAPSRSVRALRSSPLPPLAVTWIAPWQRRFTPLAFLRRQNGYGWGGAVWQAFAESTAPWVFLLPEMRLEAGPEPTVGLIAAAISGFSAGLATIPSVVTTISMTCGSSTFPPRNGHGWRGAALHRALTLTACPGCTAP